MLQNVSLTNFRNYKQIEVNTDAELVIILGENASGKTNFLESVYFLSRLKSFRAPDNLLVTEQEDYFKIGGTYKNQKLEAIVQVNPKLARGYKIDDLKVKKLNWKTFANVLFVPQDLNMFEQGPTLRRKFLNQTLNQINFEYALDMVTLDHVLKQKSALFPMILDRTANATDLEVWNLELARVSVSISKHRRAFTDFLNEKLQRVYNSISDFSSNLHLSYKGVEARSVDEFMQRIEKYKDAEIRSGQNLYGPHRDDFVIEKDGKGNIYNSSRGELRTQILALKLLQATYLDNHKLKTVILMDDVFSELDEIRRSKLISSLSGHQIFITTTEEHHLPKFDLDAKILNVANGQIKTA